MSKTRNAFLLVRINAEERAEIQNRLGEVWAALDGVLRKLAVID